MADKYNLVPIPKFPEWYILNAHDKEIARIWCTQDTASLIDNALNQTSRAGSKTSQAKRDASKKNIAKRWNKDKPYVGAIEMSPEIAKKVKKAHKQSGLSY